MAAFAGMQRPRASVVHRPGVRRQHDFEHFDVVRVTELGVTDARRLMHARPSGECHLPHAFVVELDPSFSTYTI